VLQIPAGSAAAERFQHCIAQANKWIALVPPSLPMAGLIYSVGLRWLAKAQRIEASSREVRWIRGRRGVVLSAGGFIMNPKMVKHYAPRYAPGLPHGTLGDNGSGLFLGASAGGALDLMGRISAWRFINPPAAWAEGMLVDGRGARFVNETLYGAALGDAIVETAGGKAWVVLDSRLRAKAVVQSRDSKIVPFQRGIAKMNHLFNCRSAPSLDALAAKIGADPEALRRSAEDYNRAARGEVEDVFEKQRSEMSPIAEPPFFAIDASVDSRFLPLSTMTVGGLRVDQDSGLVLGPDNKMIPGLYAAGRNAVGICSNLYVSGLSYADCVFSGRRAARNAASAG